MHYERLHLLKKETSVMTVCITTNGIYHDCNLYYDDVPRITLRCLFPSHFFLCAIRSQSAKQGTLSMYCERLRNSSQEVVQMEIFL